MEDDAEAMLIINPLPFSIIAGNADLIALNMAATFKSKEKFQLFVSHPRSSRRLQIPRN